VSTRTAFRRELRERLLASDEKILLRIVVGPDFDQPKEFSGKTLVERAEQLASSCGSPKGRAVVLLLLPHSPELFLLQLGLVLKGHVPAVLAWPTSRVDAEKYQRNLVHQLSHLPADQLITLPRLAENLAGSVPCQVTGINLENGGAFERTFPAGPVSTRLGRRRCVAGDSEALSDEALFLQFSGGTTGAQKAIVVTSEMLSRQLQTLSESLGFTADEVVVSWLPLYHDMGLIACYWMPLWRGASSIQIAANDWVINPELLLRCVSRYRATFCWLPNFAFSYLSQRRELMRESYELDSVRAWINCSEPVRLKSIDAFTRAFAEWGVRPESTQACYAMAESVFAVTQSRLGRPLSTIKRTRIRQSRQAFPELAFDLIDEVYVSSGKPISEAEVKIVGGNGSICQEAIAGEIRVRAPFLFSGYWGTEGFQTHSLAEGWHATGDFGFLANGELYVIGRFKDIVIVGGNNICPEDVEAVVNSIENVYPGRVVAFGMEDTDYGTQSLAVVAEMKGEFSEESAAQLEAAIRRLVLAAIGVAPRHVAVVPARWIVKSTAGKISRRETRQRFLQAQRMALS